MIRSRLLILAVCALLAGCIVTEVKEDVPPTPVNSAQSPDFADLALDELLSLARQSYAAGEYGVSEEAYRAYLDRVPLDADAWMRLGTVYARTGRPAEAVIAYQESVVRDPTLAKAWHNMGVIQLNQAANSFQKLLLHARPDDPMSATAERTRKGILMLMQGELPDTAGTAPAGSRLESAGEAELRLKKATALQQGSLPAPVAAQTGSVPASQ